MASKMSGGFLALQAKKSKEKKKTADLEDAFRSADTDKDGRLTINEWVEVLKSTGHNITRYVVIMKKYVSVVQRQQCRQILQNPILVH